MLLLKRVLPTCAALAFAYGVSCLPAVAAAPDITTKIHTTVPPAGAKCPQTISFAGTLTATNWAAGMPHELTYRWTRSDGATSSPQKVTFHPGIDSTDVSETWTIGKSFAGWEALEVLAPVAYTSHHHDFTLACDVVATPTPAPRPTEAPAGVSSVIVSTKIAKNVPADTQPCPKTVTFAGTLSASNFPATGSKVVKYTWTRSDGATGPVETADFAGKTSVEVSTTWTLGKTFTGWQALEIISPVPYASHHHDFTLTCPTEQSPQQAPHH